MEYAKSIRREETYHIYSGMNLSSSGYDEWYYKDDMDYVQEKYLLNYFRTNKQNLQTTIIFSYFYPLWC